MHIVHTMVTTRSFYSVVNDFAHAVLCLFLILAVSTVNIATNDYRSMTYLNSPRIVMSRRKISESFPWKASGNPSR